MIQIDAPGPPRETATATPATLLVMLYDRLLLDLQRAEKAQREDVDAVAGHAAQPCPQEHDEKPAHVSTSRDRRVQ